MSFVQSITADYRQTGNVSSGFQVTQVDRLAPMDRKTRSEYGARLLAARKHKGLSQTALANAVGMSQSAYGQAETTGSGSSFTSQLAEVCGVRSQWLATGIGSMFEKEDGDEDSEFERIQFSLDVLSEALQRTDKNTRLAIEPLLSSMANEPADAKNKSALILRLLVSEHDKPRSSPHDRMHQPHIHENLGVLDLGDGNGQGDSSAAAGRGKN